MTVCRSGSNPVAVRPSPECRCKLTFPSLTCDKGTCGSPALPLLLAACGSPATAATALADASADGIWPAGNAWYSASKLAAALSTHSADCGPLFAAALFLRRRGMAAAGGSGRGQIAAPWAARAAARGERLSYSGHGRHATGTEEPASSPNERVNVKLGRERKRSINCGQDRD